jgi:methyl-accepting chemotaxis protein
VLFGGIILFLLVISSIAFEQCSIRKLAKNAMVEHTHIIKKMRALIFQQLVEDWEKQNVGNYATVRKQFQNKNYEAIPILSSFEIMKSLGGHGESFEVRTPAEKPRNRLNSPTNTDIEMFQKMKTEDLDEYFFYDSEGRFFSYTKIKMDKHCLECHGDQANSTLLWGNNEGMDPTGHKMEGYKAGDFYGTMVMSFDKNVIAEEALNESVLKAVPQAIVFMIIVLTIIYLLWKSIKPLDNIASSFDEINKGEGNLSQKLAVQSHDEVGKIAVKFNRFLDNLTAMVRVINSSSDYIADASIEVTNSSGSLSNSAQEQVTLLQEAIRFVSEIKETVDSAVKMAENQAAIAGGNRQIMERLTESIKEINITAQNANNRAEETFQHAMDGERVLENTVIGMKEITTSSSKIGDFVSIINDISDQINLLSLNASIEAARAGEHGKGFAVVAEEIAKLAEQTASGTNEIKKLIQEANSKTEEGSRLVTETAESLKLIIENVKSSTELMDAIAKSATILEQDSKMAAGNSKEVNRLSGEIARLIKEQGDDSERILKDINKINELTTDVAANAEELTAQSEELSSHSTILKNLIGKFKTQ